MSNLFSLSLLCLFSLNNIDNINSYRIVQSNITKDQLCLTEECIESSHQFFKSMDRSVDPCQDFNKFVCGRFIRESIIPDKQQIVDLTTTKLKDIIYDRGQMLMETESDDMDEFEIDQKIKDFYTTCTDVSQREKEGTKPILDILNNIGGWPVLGSKELLNSTKTNAVPYKWYEQIPKIFELNMGNPMWLPLMAIGVTVDTVKNREQNSLGTDQPSFYPATQTMLSYGITYPTVKVYHKYAVDSAIFLGANETVAEKDMEEVIEFEILLAKASTKETARNATLVNSTIIQDLPEFPCGTLCQKNTTEKPTWENFFNNIFAASGNNITLSLNESIIHLNPPYFNSLIPLINGTNPRTIANYIGWRMVVASMNHLNEKAREMFRKVTTPIGSIKQTCLNTMGFNNYRHGLIHGAIGSMYARKYFDSKEKTPVNQIFEYLRKSFHEMIDGTDWMGDDAKTMAKNKLESMKQNIAYPNELLNRSVIDEYYKDILLSKNKSYFDNLRELVKNSVRHNLGKLREPVDPNSWGENQVVVVPNAYYVPLMNEMRFPAAFLQGIYYNSKRPQYLNFGGIGSLIGHEMTHGFDRQGRNFDDQGNKVDWWTSHEDIEFEKRGNCLVKQYDRFTIEQLKPYLEKFDLTANPEVAKLLNVNGKLTLDENIADNGGIKEAYYAYLQWVSDNKGNLDGKGNVEEKRLPGFEEFTPRQMFWISYAQMYCAKWTDNGIFKLLTEDTHTPGGYRTHGVVMNSYEFADDFKCTKGSPMNPEKKCQVWTSSKSKSSSIINIKLPSTYEEVNLYPENTKVDNSRNRTVETFTSTIN